MAWSMRIFSKAWKRRNVRQKELEEKLRSLAPEDRQKVRAYLSVNSGDEAFIRQFLGSKDQANS